ncbi:hypothetical protein L0244_38580, partial [bacterium]|nr:hypothetical protein [bacterium]
LAVIMAKALAGRFRVYSYAELTLYVHLRKNIEMRRVWIKIFAFMLMLLPVFALAQESESPKATKAQKRAEAKKKERLMNEQKAEIEGRKMHKAIQTKEVRKRMKKSEKEANRWNTGRRKFFIVRWFEKKR